VLWISDGRESRAHEVSVSPDATVWLVQNKIDLDAGKDEGANGEGSRRLEGAAVLRISAARGDGISDLVAALTEFVRNFFGSGEDGLIGRERQRKLLVETADALQRSIAAAGEGEELAAEELRAASQSLGRLLGRVDVEEILDVIFREFCIGK
jgi:tRNA modification GTPase